MDDVLLSVEHLSFGFDTEQGRFSAVDDVSFKIRRGEVFGLVGESGCGKSVTAMSLLRLVPSPPGHVRGGQALFNGRDLLTMPLESLRAIRGAEIGVIFQEPMTALSPLCTIGRQLMETQLLHGGISKEEARRQSLGWLRRVGIDRAEQCMEAYPHQLSGGMRQRVMIASALLLEPDLVIADEPTTAIDVTLQSQVFDLLLDVKGRETSVLFITHDMGVIWELCDRVAVMYASKIVEEGPLEDIFNNPAHPYTQGLMKAMPTFHEKRDRLYTIRGQVPNPWEYPSGCRFSDRCDYRFEPCPCAHPPMYEVGPNHTAACYLHGEDGGGPEGSGPHPKEL